MRRDPTPSAPNRQTAATVEIAGQRITLDHSGAAWLPETGDLLVADLHFEKGSAFAARGQGLLPPYDTAETLRRLEEEHRAFQEYLDRLRMAKDRAEFEQFMAERGARPESASPAQD